MTGLSGAGKSTLARGLRRKLAEMRYIPCILDGDDIRRGLSGDLGFSAKDRTENNRRVAEVAKLMAKSGVIAISALISPYHADRESARRIVTEGGCQFVEVFVDTPLSVCEQRDPKGYYKQARSNALSQFTGINAPYEAPLAPEVIVYPGSQSVDASVAAVMACIATRLRGCVQIS
jgi:bifunctional enzyme CysN/CysC